MTIDDSACKDAEHKMEQAVTHLKDDSAASAPGARGARGA